MMETIHIELKSKNALSILKSLEKAKMIKLLISDKQTKDSPVHFKGAITPDRAIELVNEIEKPETNGTKELPDRFKCCHILFRDGFI